MFDRANEILEEDKLDIYDYVQPSKPNIKELKILDGKLDVFFKTESLFRKEGYGGYVWDKRDCLIDSYQIACFAYIAYKDMNYTTCLNTLFKIESLDVKLLCLEFVCRKFKKDERTDFLALVAEHINGMTEINESSGRQKSKLISYVTGVELTEKVYG